MTTNFKSLIEKEVDRLFGEPDAANINPITGMVNWGPDEPQKRAAIVPLLAREWFAVYGPPDAPRLPLSDDDVDDYRKARVWQLSLGSSPDRSLDKATAGRVTTFAITPPSTTSLAG